MVEALLWFVDLVKIDGIFKTENYHRSFMQDAIASGKRATGTGFFLF